MIQRIQSLYFMGALALLLGCFFLPVAEISGSNGHAVKTNFFHLGKNDTNVPFSMISFTIGSLASVIILVAIFLYKKRVVQMKLCIPVILLAISLNILLFIQCYSLKNTGFAVSYKIPLVFPLVSAILSFLAYLGIKKDEELVRSYDRLR